MSGDKFSRRYSVVAEARRHWSEAEKQAVVAEAERPGVNISAIARRHGIKPSLLFRWRRLARGGQGTPAFIPITLALPAAEAPAPKATVEATPRRSCRLRQHPQPPTAVTKTCYGTCWSKLEPEDGMLWVYDVGGEVPAFSERGMEALQEIIKDQIDKTP